MRTCAGWPTCVGGVVHRLGVPPPHSNVIHLILVEIRLELAGDGVDFTAICAIPGFMRSAILQASTGEGVGCTVQVNRVLA